MPKISLGMPKLHWLKAGDEPFLRSKNPKSEARLDMVHHTLASYALAYKEAADRIISCALRRQVAYPDLDVLPAAFLYRHYLELKLKEIICRGRRLCGDNTDFPTGHDLLNGRFAQIASGAVQYCRLNCFEMFGLALHFFALVWTHAILIQC